MNCLKNARILLTGIKRLFVLAEIFSEGEFILWDKQQLRAEGSKVINRT